MTIMRTSLIAAFGLLAAGLSAPASAGATVAAKPAVAFEAGTDLHEITERHRGSWKKEKRRFSRHRGYDYHGDPDPYYSKHFKKKKRRYYRRGYSRGYDDGYYEGRRHSRYERRYRRHRHHHFPDYGFRGGFYFGDGYYGGGGFRFRY